MSQYVIETKGLTKVFGKLRAVDNLNLKIPRGIVYGFLGKNGAGKTTTIKMLLGLIHTSCGTAQVLGCDSSDINPEIKGRIGYVAENQRMYEWMKVSNIIRYTSRFYRSWNHGFCQELLDKFELPRETRVKSLSRGMKGKLALTLAISHEPELLILHDFASGLDAVVRREFLESIVEVIQSKGRTIFFSSHILNDVERIADHIGIIDKGELKIDAPLDRLKASVKKVRLLFKDEAPDSLNIKGILNQKRDGQELLITIEEFSESKIEALRKLPIKTMEIIDLNLEDIFVEYVR